MADETDNVVPFAPREKEPDDGTSAHFIRIAPARRKKCEHLRVEVDPVNREVTCRDCGAIVQPFDALLNFAYKCSTFDERFKAAKAEMERMLAWKPWLKAVKALEATWRGSMLPLCPHCHKGIEAQDLASSGSISRAYATRLREVEAGEPNGALKQHPPEPDEIS